LQSGTMDTTMNTILADRVLCDLIDEIERTLTRFDDDVDDLRLRQLYRLVDDAANILSKAANYLSDLRERSNHVD
jgi:hypothetical protein